MSAADLTSDVGEVASSATRRRSGRVSKKPEKLASASSPAGSAKRKRGDNDDSGVEADDPSTDEQSDSSEGEPDEEELRERQRKRRGKAPAKRPAPKKSKTNGAPISLAMRPATNASRKLTKRPRKAAIRKSAIAEEEPEGLYGRQFWRTRNIRLANSAQPMYSPVETDSKMLQLDGCRASMSTKRELWPRLSTWCCVLLGATCA
jgi:cohesin complex subunit SA-1/2